MRFRTGYYSAAVCGLVSTFCSVAFAHSGLNLSVDGDAVAIEDVTWVAWPIADDAYLDVSSSYSVLYFSSAANLCDSLRHSMIQRDQTMGAVYWGRQPVVLPGSYSIADPSNQEGAQGMFYRGGDSCENVLPEARQFASHGSITIASINDEYVEGAVDFGNSEGSYAAGPFRAKVCRIDPRTMGEDFKCVE